MAWGPLLAHGLTGRADLPIPVWLFGWGAAIVLVVSFLTLRWGHIAALVLAHDRALAMYGQATLAVRSQYWMLGIMVGFTTLALWLLAGRRVIQLRLEPACSRSGPSQSMS